MEQHDLTTQIPRQARAVEISVSVVPAGTIEIHKRPGDPAAIVLADGSTTLLDVADGAVVYVEPRQSAGQCRIRVIRWFN